jgi:hypothetical protein
VTNSSPNHRTLTHSLVQVYDPAISFATLASRAQARITEVRGQAAEAATIVVPAPLGNVTLSKILAAFTAAGASRTFLPEQTTPTLAPLNFTYDLATWQGNTTAYMQCSLDARGAQFIGTCVAQNVTCAVTSNDTTPYNCTNVASGSAIAGNISVVAYRWVGGTGCAAVLCCASGLCRCAVPAGCARAQHGSPKQAAGLLFAEQQRRTLMPSDETVAAGLGQCCVAWHDPGLAPACYCMQGAVRAALRHAAGL